MIYCVNAAENAPRLKKSSRARKYANYGVFHVIICI